MRVVDDPAIVRWLTAGCESPRSMCAEWLRSPQQVYQLKIGSLFEIVDVPLVEDGMTLMMGLAYQLNFHLGPVCTEIRPGEDRLLIFVQHATFGGQPLPISSRAHRLRLRLAGDYFVAPPLEVDEERPLRSQWLQAPVDGRPRMPTGREVLGFLQRAWKVLDAKAFGDRLETIRQCRPAARRSGR